MFRIFRCITAYEKDNAILKNCLFSTKIFSKSLNISVDMSITKEKCGAIMALHNEGTVEKEYQID